MTDGECNIEAENVMVDQLIAEHERAEEIAQVALDALTFAKCLMNTGCALDSGFADYEAEYAGEQSRFTDIETSLRLRLRALGVEVPK